MSEGEPLGVGAALAQAREAQGLALAEISHQLKFMPRQLEALEHERFDQLPGPTIARGMVRTYARFLKLDPEPLLARMAGHVEPRDATPRLAERFQQPVPFVDHGRRSTIAYLALSAAVLSIAGGVLYEWRAAPQEPQFISAAQLPSAKPAHRDHKPAPPASTQVASAAPAAQVASAAPSQAVPSQRAQGAPPSPAPVIAAQKMAPPPEAPQKSVAAPAPQKVADASAAPKSVGSRRMVFRFEQEAWIEVTDGLGRVLASSLNPAGSERVIQGKPPFSLVIGNANHVKLSYNERDVDLQPHVRVEVARFTLP